MKELERTDLETKRELVIPFYLIKDSSMINSLVFRDPSDYQYACLNQDTFEKCRPYLITRENIDSDRLEAQLDPFPNTIHWFAQRVDKLWDVYKVKSLDEWYLNSSFEGYFSSQDIKKILPNTYQRFQNKREELSKKQRDFDRWLNSLRPEFAGEAPF